MTNYFFINPAAGQGKGVQKLTAEIHRAAEALQLPCEIYVTTEPGDGEVAARRTAEALGGSPARFYACGGDGTFNEVVNGVYGFDNIAVGCVPIGTGNDMVRNFPEAGDFLNMKAQLLGEDTRVDLMQYTGIIDGRMQTRYCANMFNVGFDCNVVELASRLKTRPLISGSLAYLLAVLGTFIKKKGISLRLTEGEEVLADGEVLLCAIANGNFCGGGLKTSPHSVVDDGVFDLNIIKNVTRTTFLRLVPKYLKGTHLQVPDIERIITIKKCTNLKLTPKERTFFLCADGEISVAESVEFQLIPKGLPFIVPGKL